MMREGETMLVRDFVERFPLDSRSARGMDCFVTRTRTIASSARHLDWS